MGSQQPHDRAERLNDRPHKQADATSFIVPSGGNHPTLAGEGIRAPLLKLVYATRGEPQPTQRVCNQLPSGLDTTLSKKSFGWAWRGKIERVVGGSSHAIRF